MRLEGGRLGLEGAGGSVDGTFVRRETADFYKEPYALIVIIVFNVFNAPLPTRPVCLSI